MDVKQIKEAIDFEYDGHAVYAVVKVHGRIIARERIPRQYLKPDIDKETQAWAFTGIAKRLKAKIDKTEFRGMNGQTLN